jgi:hypothetical protein
MSSDNDKKKKNNVKLNANKKWKRVKNTQKTWQAIIKSQIGCGAIATNI